MYASKSQISKGKKTPAVAPLPVPPAKKIAKVESAPEEQEKPHPTTILTPSPHPVTPMEDPKKQSKAHPKGHRVFSIEEVREIADGKAPFMRATDTTMLSDIWLLPYHVDLPYPGNTWVNVSFREIIAGAHIKMRDVAYKVSVDDVLSMCWKANAMEAMYNGSPALEFDNWLTEMIYLFSKEHGSEDSTDRGKLCEFLINEDKVSFQPLEKNKSFTLFFRKINIHSYPIKASTEGADDKFVNLNQVKCCATRGKYEYALDTRLFLVPGLFEISPLDLPPTQKME